MWAKRKALLLLSATGLLTLILAMSLSTLTLSAGEPFSLGKTAVKAPGTSTVSGGEGLLWLLRGIAALMVIFVPIHIITSLLSAQGRKRLVRQLIAAAILFGIVAYLLEHPPKADEAATVANSEQSSGEVADGTPPAPFPEDEAPPWLAIMVILFASAFGVGLIWASLWFLQPRSTRIPLSLQSLSKTAQDTLDSLRSGEDFRTAIIRCYYEMNQVIKQERGISREISMTPHEFETYLVSRGLPQTAVETLTHLFEQVRYGNVSPHTDDELIAVDCLSKIVDSCQSTAIHP